MANGLLGKKVVNARDTEVVYTVPSSRTTTMNLNVLNDGDNAATVNVYVSDKEYQTRDFEDYLSPLNYNKTWADSDTDNTLGLIGKSSDKLLTELRTTPHEAISPSTASSVISSQDIETLQTANVDGNFFLVTDADTNGEAISFWNGGELYMRSAQDGGVYTFDQFYLGSSATTAATAYGITGGERISWATNIDGPFGLAYAQGTPGAAGTYINTIADYRATTASYNTAFAWALGTISCAKGVKTTEERFIIGTTTGTCYVSDDDTPEAQLEFTSNTIFSPTGVTGHMIGAVAIEGSTAGEGNVYIAYSGGQVAYAAYDANTAFPTSGYSSFDFPTGLSALDIVDVRAEGGSLVLISKTGYKHSTSDLGVTWTGSKHYAKYPISIEVASVNAQNRYVLSDLTTNIAEMTLVRGRTYQFLQHNVSNNTHPLQFSTVSGGPHSNGTTYSTGMRFYMGDPTATGSYAVDTSDNATWLSDHATYNGQARIIEWTVPSDAPDTMYVYCPNHTGMGWSFSIVTEETTEPHDDQTALVTQTIWNSDNGDADRRYDLFFNGEAYMREKRFYALPQADKYEKAEISAGEILERTAIMASAGEQVIVTTNEDDIIVRIHGIEE
jgi:hypothetical protein